MPNIPFTRFHLPMGRQTPTELEVDQETADAAAKIIAAGFRFTVEILSNGSVSQCIEDRDVGDYDCVICANGPDVPAKAREMVLRFNPEEAALWRKTNG